MNFEYSETSRQLMKEVQAFLAEHLYPIEKELNHRIEDGDDRWSIPPEIEEIGGYVEPLTKNFLYPRLFVLNPDGTGFEWLTKEQLDYYKRT